MIYVHVRFCGIPSTALVLQLHITHIGRLFHERTQGRGVLSDSRVAASLVDLCESEVLERLRGRWVFFERDFTSLFGDWQRWRGVAMVHANFAPGRRASQVPRLLFPYAPHQRRKGRWV